jgi:hypothetical protein
LRQRSGERHRELKGAITASFDGDAFATLSVVHRTACDGARSVATDLDHESGDHRRLVGALQLIRRLPHQVRFRPLGHKSFYSEPWT